MLDYYFLLISSPLAKCVGANSEVPSMRVPIALCEIYTPYLSMTLLNER